MNITPAVKNILLINVAVYIIQLLLQVSGSGNVLIGNFALNFSQAIFGLKPWTIFTYMFLHGSFFHILFNMLVFFFIGVELERTWGARKFTLFYLLTGLGAGIFIALVTAFRIWILGNPLAANEFTVGASGAIFALMLAYSLIYAERQITLLLFFILPVTIRAKYLVWASLLLTIIFVPFSGASISHSGHIGGILAGMLFFIIFKNQSAFSYGYARMTDLFSDFFSSLNPFKRTPKRPTRVSRGGFFKSSRANADNFLDETRMSDLEIEEQIDQLLEIISQKRT